MTKSGVTHTDTASGKGHGHLTEHPAAPSPMGGTKPNTDTPAPSSEQMHAQAERKEKQARAGDQGSTGSAKDAPQQG